MKRLMPYEKKWIVNRLKIYRIKYAEIYNEVYDHILSACDDKRQNGDSRPILSLFQETMDQDIGSHAGIAQMTSEREHTLKATLRSSLIVELKSYLVSIKLIIPFIVVCFIYGAAVFFQLNPNWLVIVSLLVAWIPYLYLLAIGTKNGYLRTIRSRRKTSLVNHLMFRISNSTVTAIHFGIFCIPALTELIPIGIASSYSVKSFINFLGYPGFAVIIAIATIYALAFIKVAKTDYRHLIQQVI